MSKNLLGEYIAELTDFTANGSFADLRENVKYYNEYNYAALVRTTDLDKYNFQPEVFTDKNGYEFLVKSRLFGGEIIVANVGSVGKVFKVPYYSLPMTLGPNAYLVRFDKDKIDQEYAYQFLISDFFKTELYRKIGSTTLQAINKDNFRSIELFVPNDINNQQRIARILSTADGVIEKTQAAIAKYKAIKQGMLQDLFTRGIDLSSTSSATYNKLRPRFEDAPELYKESKLGMIPREWDVDMIGNCIEPIMSNVDKHIREEEEKVSLCNYMDVYSNRYLTKEISFSVGSVNAIEFNRFSLLPQDVIITKDSETPDDIGVPSLVSEKITNLICGYHLCILRSKNLEKLNGEFLMLQLQVHEINKQFANRANGSTRYGLTIDSIKECYLIIPNNINEQIGIAKRLRSIDTKLKTEQSYLQKMQMVKKGLMEDLLSGKVKVSESKFSELKNEQNDI